MKSHLVKIPKEQPTGTVAVASETYYCSAPFVVSVFQGW